MSVGRNTTYNIAGGLIPLALSFATVPAYLHLVGADRYGVLSIAWLLLGYFGMFDLGLGRATSFRMASLKTGSNGERADVFQTAMAINAGIGLIGGLLLWAAGSWFFGSVFKVDAVLRAEVLRGLPWLAASVPVATMTGVLTGALQGREKFLETNMVSVISTVLFQLLPLGVAWHFGPDLSGLLAAAVMARVAAIAVLWLFCRREFTQGHRPSWRRDQARDLLAFGGWVTFNGLMGPLLIMADRFAIGAVLDARAVAIYTIPFQLAQRSGIITTALTGALFPRLTSLTTEARRALLDKAIRSLAALLTIPIYIGLFVIYPFLKLWIGAELASASYRIGMIVMIAFWANSFVAVYFTYFQADGRPSAVAKILALQVIPYLMLLWMVLRRWGIEGAAWLFLVRAFLTLLPIFLTLKPSAPTCWLVGSGMAGLASGFLLSENGAADCLGGAFIATMVFSVLSGFAVNALRNDFPKFFVKVRLARR